MPREYEAIRDSLERRHVPAKKAKRIAAATYNKRHPGHPMHPDMHKKHHGRTALTS